MAMVKSSRISDSLVRQFDSNSLFWVVYIVAIVFSFVGVLVSSRLRHDREMKKILRKFEEVRRDPSRAWPYDEEKY
jgi:hypothetical protein